MDGCTLVNVITLQVDSLSQLASVLVNVTDSSDEIMSEDVSLTVGLLDTIANSTEDLQQRTVSILINCHVCCVWSLVAFSTTA